MKSNWKATSGVLLALSFLAAACGSDGGGTEAGSCEVGQVDGDLALYNWAEYIDEEQLDEFATEFEIGATMDSYESNEVLQPKIAAGNSGYDVIVPSDYMVGILIAGEHVQQLNKDLIPNLSNVSSDFANPSYDPEGSYAVPYQWGLHRHRR